MSYIDPDQFHGALNSTITFLKDADNQADLTAGGVVPATLQTKLGGILSDQETKKAARDKAKTAHTTAQGDFADGATTNYAAYSSAIDAIAGALGKNTPKGRQVLGYRHHLNENAHKQAPQPAPAPASAKP
jgi:hypothetical protein